MPPSFPLISAVPFALMLAAIAILPLAAPRWSHRNRNRALMSFVLAAPVAIYLLFAAPGTLWHTLHDYLSFLILLGSLYTISGGIVLEGDLEPTPLLNAGFLTFGAAIANLFGTTGASMLLLRPMLRMNRDRRRMAHIPFFFILIVSNAGGMLTPLGDPPLFLGYLRGVPFFWTLRLVPVWLVSVGYLVAVFLVADILAARRETKAAPRPDPVARQPLRLRGVRSLLLLTIVAVCALLPSPWREIAMLACAGISYFTSPKPYHRANEFNFAPMAEVAILFAGIFVTMVPALEILRERSASFGLTAPWQYFWLTGGLSSLLDNAPTYLTFLSLAQGIESGGPVVGISHILLEAISAGAVLMGANTYIGNGPNFMVKALSEQQGVPLPSFLGFALRSVLVLLPLYVALTVIFFR